MMPTMYEIVEEAIGDIPEFDAELKRSIGDGLKEVIQEPMNQLKNVGFSLDEANAVMDIACIICKTYLCHLYKEEEPA